MYHFELNVSTRVVDILVAAEMASCKAEARRLILQNAVLLNGNKVSSIEQEIEATIGNHALQVGQGRLLLIKGTVPAA